MKSLPTILLLSIILFSCTQEQVPIEEEISEIEAEEQIKEDEDDEEEEIEIVPTIWTNGDGSYLNPFQIETAGHLFYLSEQVNDTLTETPNDYSNTYFKVINDIDLARKPFESIGGLKNYYEFKGHLDGNNKVISNLYINNPERRYTGLFGKTGGRPTLKNIRLSNVEIIGADYTGAIVGRTHSELIENCTVEGRITGARFVGGIIGYADTGEDRIISNCSFEGTVIGTEQVGGIAGHTRAGYMNDCYSEGSITGDYRVGGLTGYGFYFELSSSSSIAVVTCDLVAGGLAGEIDTAKIKDSFFKGAVVGLRNAGGISGSSSASDIENSYNLGTIEGDQNVAGLIGYLVGTSIQKSFNSGSISGGALVGGIAGEVRGASITHCYNSGQLSGGARVAGIAGGVVNGTISYCYNLAELPDLENTSMVDQIATDGLFFGIYDEFNCYYLGNFDNGKSKTSAYMKSVDFLNDLNILNPVWKLDATPNKNNGFPIHDWQ